MKIFRASYFDNAPPGIEEVECIRMDELYVYTQVQRYNTTKPLRLLRKQADGAINHFETRREAVEYLDQHGRGIIEKARRVYEKLKNKHLEFLNDNRD